MPKQARVGDISQGWTTHHLPCCPHFVTSTFIEGVEVHKTNGLASTIIGSKVTSDCPHCNTGHAITGSSTYNITGKAAHRIGDEVELPCGIVITQTGSPDQEIGG